MLQIDLANGCLLGHLPLNGIDICLMYSFADNNPQLTKNFLLKKKAFLIVVFPVQHKICQHTIGDFKGTL